MTLFLMVFFALPIQLLVSLAAAIPFAHLKTLVLISDETENELLFASVLPTAYGHLWFKSKHPSMIKLSRLLKYVATFQGIIYLSDESIWSQVNHQSLKKENMMAKYILRDRKHSFSLLSNGEGLSEQSQAHHRSNFYCENSHKGGYKRGRWSSFCRTKVRFKIDL